MTPKEGGGDRTLHKGVVPTKSFINKSPGIPLEEQKTTTLLLSHFSAKAAHN